MIATGSHAAQRSFGARVREFWKAPDEFLRDAGKAAELVIARLRLGVTLVLLLFPVASLALSKGAERDQDLVTFFIAFAALLVALLVLFLVQQDRRQRWLPMTTSLIDVSLISLGLLAHGLLHLPGEVLEARGGFDLYFLALAATCLRYDARVALVAGVVAIGQYLTVAAIAVYGLGLDPVVSVHDHFPFTQQIARALLLAGATGISMLIVSGLERQRRLSSSDPLTGLFNRRFFDTHLSQEVGRALRYQRRFSVAMIDVDHFKAFNDAYGHPTGDRALQMLARVVKHAVRRSDLVARYGGEEIVVILREVDGAAAVDRVEAIRRAVEAEPFIVDSSVEPVYFTVSAGVASWPEDGAAGVEVVAAADRRLFQAKAAGRNCVVGPPTAPSKASRIALA